MARDGRGSAFYLKLILCSDWSAPLAQPRLSSQVFSALLDSTGTSVQSGCSDSTCSAQSITEEIKRANAVFLVWGGKPMHLKWWWNKGNDCQVLRKCRERNYHGEVWMNKGLRLDKWGSQSYGATVLRCPVLWVPTVLGLDLTKQTLPFYLPI